jgi:hypothetical protein
MPISSLEGKYILWTSAEDGAVRLDFVQHLLPGGFVFMTQIVRNLEAPVEGEHYSRYRHAPVGKIWSLSDLASAVSNSIYGSSERAWDDFLLIGNEEAA